MCPGWGGFDAEAQDPAGSAGAQSVRIVDRVATAERGHDEGQELVADVRRVGGAAQVEEPIGQSLQAQVEGQRGWQEEPAPATRRSSSKAVSMRSTVWDDRINQVLLCWG